MNNQEMQFADPDWKPSQQLDTQNNAQEQEVYTPQPVNSDYREQNKWSTAPSSMPQQEGYTGLRPYAGPVPGQMQGGNYRQRPYSRRGRGPWFWIILAFIIFSLISGGSHFGSGFGSGPDFNHGPFPQKQFLGQPYDYTVTGQATVVINDPNGNVTVTQGPSNDVNIQTVEGNNFPGNPNDIKQGITKNGNTITVNIPDSVDLQVTVPSGANLSLNSGSGTINVTGVNGQMTLDTNDGTINASNDTLSGSSTLTTNSGDINFEGTISAGGNYQFNTTSGTVTVALPTSPAFHVVATTNSGSINIPGVQNNSSGTQATGNVGANSQAQGTNVTMKSDNSDINLNQK
jgi:Putative adhesin